MCFRDSKTSDGLLLCMDSAASVCFKAFRIQTWLIHYFIPPQKVPVADLFSTACQLIILWALSINGYSISVGVLHGLQGWGWIKWILGGVWKVSNCETKHEEYPSRWNQSMVRGPMQEQGSKMWLVYVCVTACGCLCCCPGVPEVMFWYFLCSRRRETPCSVRTADHFPPNSHLSVQLQGLKVGVESQLGGSHSRWRTGAGWEGG